MHDNNSTSNGFSLSGGTTTTNSYQVIPAQPDICPSCGKCRQCGQPTTPWQYPLFQLPYHPNTSQQPYISWTYTQPDVTCFG